jgi:hypothetical protein
MASAIVEKLAPNLKAETAVEGPGVSFRYLQVTVTSWFKWWVKRFPDVIFPWLKQWYSQDTAAI